MILGPFQCSFCKYPQIHKFIKWQQKTSAGQTLYRTLCLHIYGGGNVYLDRDMEKPGSSAHFPKRTGCMPWFFRMSAPIIIVASIVKKNWIKKFNSAFFKGYIYTRGSFQILIINAPKWRRSAGNWNSRVMQRFRVQRRL